MSEHDITLTVDGERAELTVEARTLLVHALREDLNKTIPQVGCESSACGACTVRVDGDAVKSCTVLAVQADGADVTTAAGLTEGDELHPVQRAFHDAHGLQCGYCTPGMVMTTIDILENHPAPSREAIRRELKGNVCRCTGYQNIVDAVQLAAADSTDIDGDQPPAAGERGGD